MDKVCTKCKEKKPTTNFSRDARMRDGFYAWCKPCKSTASAMHAVANKEQTNERARRFYRNNPEKKKLYNKTYETKKRKTDPKFRMLCSLRASLHHWLKGNIKTVEYLGCDLAFFKLYIESKFQEGMDWSNYGKQEACWQLDHIRPASLANRGVSLTELWHYTNFQPLWKEDNLKKSNK